MSAAVRLCPQCGSEYSTDIKFCPKDGSTLRVPPGAALIGAVIADRYHIIRKLGEGGMGQVFLAEHVKMGRPSAIKVMAPAMMQDADAISRFNREAANASRINHPNVAAIYDFGETSDGLIYLAMEYVEGAPLTAVLARAGPLPPPRAAAIIRQTASALDAAHERGIVHRDLKPDNIMIARNRDGSDLVKVVDFGIAKSQHGAGQKVTKTGLVVGTPEYMSPEQLAGDAVDARSDTYALALVAFHVLTCALPYDEGSAQETMIRRLTSPPRTLAEVRPQIAWPPALERAIARALERDATRRPESSGAFAEEFAAALDGLKIADAEGATQQVESMPATRVGDAGPTTSAPVPTRWAPPARAGGKRRWVIGGVSAAAVALVAVLVVARRAPPPGPATSAAPPTDTNAKTKTFSRALDSGAPLDSTASTEAAKDSPAVTHTPPPRIAARPVAAPASPLPAPPAAPPPAPPPIIPARKPGVPVHPPTPEESARAVKGVENAAKLIEEQKPGLALGILGRVLPYLPTRADSAKAYYHMSEALLQASEKNGDASAKNRACEILSRLRQDPARTMASSVEFLYGQECK